jgi:uncharacterized protein YbjQ (UPF0145 family)
VPASLHGFRSLLSVLSLQFEAVGSVTGAYALQMGYAGIACTYWGDTANVPVIAANAENFHNQLWAGAIDRLEQDALRVGADGVVGVSVVEQPLDTNGHQLQLVGTAIRLRTVKQLPRPFLSALSMDDFLKLLMAGWVPTGIAWGHSAVHVHGWLASPWRQGVARQNAEMAGPTMGVNAARERAQLLMHKSMQGCRAQGTVGTSITITRHAQSCGSATGYGRRDGTAGMLISAHAVGTGVVRYRDPVARAAAAIDLKGAANT